MSVEDAVTDGLQHPINPNVESAQDVENMLAELKGEPGAQAAAKTAESAEEVKVEGREWEAEDDYKQDIKSEEKPDTTLKQSETRTEYDRPQRRNVHGDSRPGRGGRGRGGFKSKSYRENIKSDFTSAPETDDPVQIRKQVHRYTEVGFLCTDKL